MTDSEHSFLGSRLRTATIIAGMFLSVVVFRLWYLQGFQGEYYRDLSENNRKRTVRTIPPRGRMFDREGRLLVSNRPAFDVALVIEDIQNLDEVITQLAELSGRSAEELRHRLTKDKRRLPFEPKVVLSDISRLELARIKVNTHRLPGVIINVTPRRTYPYQSIGAQTLGYAREITRLQLEALGKKAYKAGDIIGQTGLEKSWEQELRGTSGYVQVEVDARGNKKRELGIVDFKKGRDVYLTLDLDLQKAAEQALKGKRGALAALNPQNGEVLALVSVPSFDANIFSREMSGEDWKRLNNRELHPLTNRPIAALYPPGSTYKLILAVAGLAEKKVSSGTQFDCPGYYLFKGRRYHCHKRSGHGKVTIREAIRGSCNAYFYKLGQLLSIDTIHKYSKLFGLGKRTGISLPGESSGLIPSSQWKIRQHGERWYPGDTISVSVGQGYVSVTPLQMALSLSILANDGTVHAPTLVRQVVDERTGETKHFNSEIQGRLPVSKKILAKVREYASEVVHHERGTGGRAKIDGVLIGGKTGTAQVTSLARSKLSDKLQDHAWFVAFGPLQNPSIAIAVIVENGGHGGVAAAPIAREVMKVHFEKHGLIDMEEEKGTEVSTKDPLRVFG